MKLKFYRDDAGDARARGRGRGKVVAGFLESDLQDSPESAREVLQAIDDIEAGRADTWERTGNAYTLDLSPLGAVLLKEVDEEAVPSWLPLSEMREVVEGWVSFLSSA